MSRWPYCQEGQRRQCAKEGVGGQYIVLWLNHQGRDLRDGYTVNPSLDFLS
jgi:hypothetical protein